MSNKNKNYDGYKDGEYKPTFWIAFGLMVIILGITGTAGVIICFQRVMDYGIITIWSLGIVVSVVLLFSFIFFLRLLSGWADMARTLRLWEERIQGGLTAVSIEKYVKDDKKRNEDLIEIINQNQNIMGKTMSEKIESSNRKNLEMVDSLTHTVKSQAEKMDEFSKQFDALFGVLSKMTKEPNLEERANFYAEKATVIKKKEQKVEEEPTENTVLIEKMIEEDESDGDSILDEDEVDDDDGNSAIIDML